MAPRRVIADSDNEDEDDIPLSPPGENTVDPPVPEPLSPHHQPSSLRVPNSHNQVSDTTDQSFFVSVYDDQQSRALEQSQLIGHIIRQSHKASGSSGDISLPAKGKGRKANASSATNITSPVVISKPKKQLLLFSDDATNVTTPRKSMPGEWDVPSSAESSKGKNEKSYGKRRRSQSKGITSSAAGEVFMSDDVIPGETSQDVPLHDEMPDATNSAEPFPQSAAKRRKVSHHDSVVPDTANFYIAQSNLTTMQKLEYQKVHPRNGYSGLPGSLGNQKSSCATTIAYPTPSRYASSSGPPLPWERCSTTGSPRLIDITSSPDVIAFDHDYTERITRADTPHVGGDAVQNDIDAPSEHPTMKHSPSKKRRNRPKITQDEDELAYEGPKSPRAIDCHQDNHEPQPSRRRSNSPSSRKGDNDIGQDLITNPHEEVPQQELDELASEIPATEVPMPIDTPKSNHSEIQPTPLPKKRGRKKKQPTSEQPIENEATTQEQLPGNKAPEVQNELAKPKKKRGRPRKSDQANPEIAAVPGPDAPQVPETYGDNDQHDELALEQPDPDMEKPKPKKESRRKEKEKETTDEPAPSRETSPLKEISTNSKTSQSTLAEEGVSARSNSKPADRDPTPGSHAKQTPATAPKATPSQPKVPYRVGLSKRSKIASLLKSVKR
ncbi:hypothetical protein AAE478_005473 [Parahypoxylon ruwenzoriense]